MSDIRFTLIGIVLIFLGFLVLGIFGSQFNAVTIELQEFGNCYEYFDDMPPTKINCDLELFDKTLFFVLVLALIASGIICMVKGIKGKWDQQVKPEDMVSGHNTDNDDNDNTSDDK